MQYILTEEEYQALKDEPKFVRDSLEGIILDLCVRVANNEPAHREWDPTNKSPWGCILERQLFGDRVYKRRRVEFYCDDCPVCEVCPYEHKSWSK